MDTTATTSSSILGPLVFRMLAATVIVPVHVSMLLLWSLLRCCHRWIRMMSIAAIRAVATTE